MQSAGTQIERMQKSPVRVNRSIATPGRRFDAHQRMPVMRRLYQRAGTLGFDLVNRERGGVLVPAVSQEERP
jgi:hypothetical protein